MTVASRVSAVVVTYQPDMPRLAALLQALDGQVAHVLVVDNASRMRPMDALPPHRGVEHLALPDNLGVGAAQNLGIRRALERDSDFVLLLDQDSQPASDMVAALVGAADAMHQAGLRVGAVGPVLHGSGVAAGFVRFGWFRYRRLAVPPGRDWLACDLLIASGCLLTRAALASVGAMDETLFIDKVDTEWCLRAAFRGYALAGVPAARLQHRLGERTLRVWWLRWRELPAHPPLRYYYIVRNSLLVWRRPHAGWRWRSADAKQWLHIVLFFGLLGSDRRDILPMMWRGLCDGLRGRSGRLPSAD